jgi:hypothetical protein
MRVRYLTPLGGFRQDEAQWPIVLVTMPPAELAGPDLLRHMDRMSSFSTRGTPFVQIIDVRAASSLGAKARRLVAERMDQDEEAYPRILLGVAIVLATPLHRGIFKAISWLSSNPCPFEAFAEVGEATTWARGLLRAKVPTHSMTMPIAPDVTKRVG